MKAILAQPNLILRTFCVYAKNKLSHFQPLSKPMTIFIGFPPTAAFSAHPHDVGRVVSVAGSERIRAELRRAVRLLADTPDDLDALFEPAPEAIVPVWALTGRGENSDWLAAARMECPANGDLSCGAGEEECEGQRREGEEGHQGRWQGQGRRAAGRGSERRPGQGEREGARPVGCVHVHGLPLVFGVAE
jgi:hypothetical protein